MIFQTYIYFSFEALTINFCSHHISTPSKPLNIDFFKIVDFQKERNFLKMMVKFSNVWKDLAFAGKYNSPKNGFCSNCQQKCYIQMLHYWCRQHNFLLKCCKTWKNLIFVGKHKPLKRPFLQHLSTKVLHLNVLLMMSAPQFSSKML